MRIRKYTPPVESDPFERLLKKVRDREDLKERLVHVRSFKERSVRYASYPPFLSENLVQCLRKAGMESPVIHQEAAWEALDAGKHVAVTTPTASGKTYAFNVPMFRSVQDDAASRALYLYPTKALAQDQLRPLQEWSGRLQSEGLRPVTAEIYDGDTSSTLRAKIRKNPPNIVLSNPDMLHLGILAFHDRWASFFQNLKYVVVDEAHSYRGIFGSHVAHVLRRLRRIAAHYGSDPRFISCSATIGNADEFLRQLTGLEYEVVSESGAPQAERSFVLWNPQGSAYTDAVTLLSLCLEAGWKTIVFTKARKITELITMWIHEAHPEWAGRIRSYRAGYLPEERRKIEQELFQDKLQAVISTSALEVGIDVGGLDACVMVGYPGTVISTWQRAGRVGRSLAPSRVFLIGMPDALDQYWMKHPDKLFAHRPESLMVGVENETIASAHLCCAAAELPLDPSKDQTFYGEMLAPLMKGLSDQHRLLEGAQSPEWFCMEKNPQRQVSIRDMGEGYQIVTLEDGELVGTIDSHRAFRDCHPGAVYLHQGTQYVVKDLRWEEKRILVSEEPVDYYTQVNYEEETEILEEKARRKLRPKDDEGRVVGASCEVRWGRVRVTQRFINFETHRLTDGSIVSTNPLTLPPQVFETESLWWVMPQSFATDAALKKMHFMGGLHAAEHATIGLMPLYVMCDRWDLGGISTPGHPQVPQPVIFIYDGCPGGVGLSRKAYDLMEDLLSSVFEGIRDCDCEEGCPACIQSPKCGSGNQPLDKKAALWILAKTLGRKDLEARKAPAYLPPARVEETMNDERDIPAAPPAELAPSDIREGGPVPDKTGPVVFDIETQYLAAEVPGGWNNLPAMKVACVVVYDVDLDRNFVYGEDDLDECVRHLRASSLVIGFNSLRFDYGVLQGSTTVPLDRLPTLDLMADLQARIQTRLSLSHLAQKNLGADKSADGLQSVQWWREGKKAQVVEYCKKDVELTYKLWRLGQEKHYVLFEHKQSKALVKCPVDW